MVHGFLLLGCKISHSHVPQLFQVLGLDFLLGNDEMWPLLLGLSGVAALLQFFLLLLCPESPRYLYIKLGKVEEAKKSKTHILGLSGVAFILYIVLNTEGRGLSVVSQRFHRTNVQPPLAKQTHFWGLMCHRSPQSKRM